MGGPKVFISYAWDDNREWVISLASRLRSHGVDVVLDKWATVPGDMLPVFMESAVRDSDYVLIVCTPAYKKKSDERLGGVGYEGDIMTAEVFALDKRAKFLPVLREGNWSEASPSWLLGAYYLDLRGNPHAAEIYEELLDVLMGKRKQAPEIGSPLPSWADLRPIEVMKIPLSPEYPLFSNGGWLTLMAQALVNTFGDHPPLRFVGLLNRISVTEHGNEYTVITLTAPYSTFVKELKMRITTLFEVSLKRDKQEMEALKSDLASTLGAWKSNISIRCDEYWSANVFEIDPKAKLVEIYPLEVDSKQEKFWRPKSTSEVLSLIAHLSNPIVQVSIDGLLTDPRLIGLTKDLLDYKHIKIERLNVSSSHPEQWQYSGDEDI